MTSLSVAGKAPMFSLKNQHGAQVSLKDFAGKYLILYFYPKALTPGCTTQACGMRDIREDLQEFGAKVIGISPDSPTKLLKFREKHNLNFDLLADEDHSIAEAYGVWGLKKFMGREFMGVIRTTFIIDPRGKVAAVLKSFTTTSHHQAVLNWFQANT